MVYKKFIKRGGKIYGPYFYKSVKKNGKVITEYLGQSGKEIKKRGGKSSSTKNAIKVLGVVGILVLLLGIFVLMNLPTERFSFVDDSVSMTGGIIGVKESLINPNLSDNVIVNYFKKTFSFNFPFIGFATGNESCDTHDSFECYSDDVYWYDSCGTREDIKESCDNGCWAGKCQYCIDSDGGQTWGVKGTCEDVYYNGVDRDIAEDYCEGNFLIELYCIDDPVPECVSRVEHECLNGCSNGACIGESNVSSPEGGETTTDYCIDSDGGKIYGTFGTCKDAYFNGVDRNISKDSCSGNILTEQYCKDGIECAPLIHTCIYGCSNGSCIGEANESEEISSEGSKQISEAEITETEVEEEYIEIISSNETEITTKRSKIVIGRPVKWIKTVKVGNATDIDIEIPKSAEDINFRTKKEIDEAIKELEEYRKLLEETNREDLINMKVTGILSEDVGEKYLLDYIIELIDYLKQLRARTTGDVVEGGFENNNSLTGMVISEDEIPEAIVEKADKKVVEVDEIIDVTKESKIAIEYYTEAPQAVEEKTDVGKNITISAPDELYYTDVLAYTELNKEVPESAVKLYREARGSKEEIKIDKYDLNKNGLIDYIEWNVDHLSEQTYELVIEITKAEHLDSDRVLISDVYDEVKSLDGVWSETISDGEYVRVVFEEALDDTKDITIYARGTGDIEVYEIGSDELIATLDVVENEYSKTYLTNLIGTQDVFDLKVVGGNLEFDHIVDPALNCGDVVVLYNFDGNATDSSGNGNDGIVTGATLVSSQAGFGQAYDLDGIDDYISVPGSASLTNITQLTVSAWIYRDDLNARDILNKGGTGWSFRTRGSAQNYAPGFTYSWSASPWGGGFWYATTSIPQGQWTHIAVTYDASSTSNDPIFYVNGVPDVISSEPSSPSGSLTDDSANPLWMGYDGWDYFNGSLDDVVIFNRTLSASEISQIYASGTPITCGNATQTCTDSDGDGYNVSQTGCGTADCNDTNASINPSASEICGNGVDDDCNVLTSDVCGGETYVLNFSTYFGGSDWDVARDVYVDDQGYIYMVGGTASPDFPTTPGAFDRTHESGSGTSCSACPSDVFVTKWYPNGSLMWSTLFGGPDYDRAYGLEVDDQGYVYVTGRGGPGLPTTSGAFQPSFQGVYANIYGYENCFVAKFLPDGSNLSWASYVGVSALCRDIAIDDNGDVYVPLSYGGSGATPPSSWFTNAYQATPNGGEETGAMKISSDGSQVYWATWLGGSGLDSGATSIRVDDNGYVYISTSTDSDDIPTTPGAFDRTYYNDGNTDFYVAKFTPDGSGLVYGTYLGGAGSQVMSTHNLAVDNSGNAYVAVPTGPDFTGQEINSFGGGTNDWGVAKLNSTGGLVASTFIGGNGNENADGMYVDPSGNFFITGMTASTDFPVTLDAYQGDAGSADAVITILSADFSQLLYSTYMGGSSYDDGRSGFLDSYGNLYLVGSTSGTGWPTQNAYQDYFAGGVGQCTQGACNAGDNILAKFSKSSSSTGGCTDSDGDGYNTTISAECGSVADCNDSNINVNPGATEICGNGVDDDCNVLTSDVCGNVTGNVYYVDGTLSSDCSGGVGDSYSLSLRDCSASDGTKAWNTIAECTTQLASNGDGGHTCFVRAGTYSETIVPASGADATHKNTYAAYNGEKVIMTEGVGMAGGQDYVRIIGFTFTGGSIHTILLYNTIGVEILYNKFTKTSPSSKAISSANAANNGNQHLIIRGNEFSYIGCTWDTDHCNNTNQGSIVMDLKGDKNILIEYNTVHNISNDVLGYIYGESIVRNNYVSEIDVLRDWPNTTAPNLVHKDFFQGSSGTSGFNIRDRIFFESNFVKDYLSNGYVNPSSGYTACINAGYSATQCAGSDEHFMLSRIAGYDDMVVRGNVVHNIGSMIYDLEVADTSRIYSNTFVDANTKVSNSYAVKYSSDSVNNINKNNLYYVVAATHLGPVQIYDTSTVTSSDNLCYSTGTGGDSGCSETTDPLFSDYANDNFYIGASSPAKDNGAYITLANGPGTDSTALVVDDAGFFTAGFGISGGVALGDTIKIGSNNPVKITAIDYATNTITLASAQTWADNEEIYWHNQDTSPDIGAWEYKSNYTLAGTWSLSGDTVTVVPNDPSLVRFVEVLEDGIPVGTVSTSPYTVSGVGSGNVTVLMFSLYASQTPIVSAGNVIPTPTCDLTNTYWSAGTSVANNSLVDLIVEGNSYCVGENVNFTIYEDDIVGDELITSIVDLFTNDNYGSTKWTATWQCDGDVLGVCTLGDPEYYFTAELISNSSESATSNSTLSVTTTTAYCGDGSCNGVENCSTCSNDCGVCATGNVYYVSPTGSGSWTGAVNCTDIANPCSLSTANANVQAGDTVYLRGGTYTITGNGIAPTNSGTTGNMITYSAYPGETPIIYGKDYVSPSDMGGAGSIGVNLNGRYSGGWTGVDYIRITGITVKNTKFLLLLHSSNYIEISHCTFGPVRNIWGDVILNGTAKNDVSNYYQSSTTLYDTDNDLSSYANRRVYNVDDKSTMTSVDSATSTTLYGDNLESLLGGTNSYWSYGDRYQITGVPPYDPAPADIGGTSTHNWIHHNTMYGAGFVLEGSDGISVFQLGSDIGGAEYNNYNTIEYNNFYDGGHHVIGINKGLYNVLRGNYVHNEAWFDDSNYSGNCYNQGLCGYRIVSAGVDNPSYGGDGLWEDNIISYGAQFGGPNLKLGASGTGMSLNTPNNIYRYNSMFGNALNGMRLGTSIVGNALNNRIYSNTFYKNGYGANDEIDQQEIHRGGFAFFQATCFYNVIKNNLFYDQWSETHTSNSECIAEDVPYPCCTGPGTGDVYAPAPNCVDVNDPYPGCTGPGTSMFISCGSRYVPALYGLSQNVINNNDIGSNYVDSSSYLMRSAIFNGSPDPLFVNPDISDPTALSLVNDEWIGSPDLSLQSGSLAIDNATYLTQANGAGSSSTTLIVDDARYFQDGSWGSDLARSNLNADWIAIGAVDNVVEISSVDYNTETITLASAMTWSDNDPIWLYKKSDGTRVLYGSAPDMGAFEFSGNVTQPTCTDSDGDGYNVSQSGCGLADCNDSDILINPSASEICGNGVDDDCVGGLDNGCGGICDTDGDGFDESGILFTWCQLLTGHPQTDCNDSNYDINPNATEICGDGIDNNCSGSDLTCVVICDADSDGYDADNVTCGGNDCNDNNATINPNATEICDGVDNNCVGGVDESLTRITTCGVGACAGNTGTETCTLGVWGGDTCDPLAGATADTDCDNIDDDCDGTADDNYVQTATTCGVGECSGNAGVMQCVGGVESDTCDPFAGAVAEACDNETGFDNLDNNCDGTADLNCSSYCDQDNDGYSPTARVTCWLFGGYSSGDCEDTIATINPGEIETCDNIDNDCSSGTADGSGESWYQQATSCGVGACASTGVYTCSAGIQTDTCSAGSPGTETCNNIDDNCDGSVDEFLTRPTTCGVGVCLGNTGTETCTLGSWGGDTCDPLAGASTELCDGILDENCDGSVDEGCSCTSGQTQQCGTTDVGECDYGLQTCNLQGAWGSCVGNIEPTSDNDCNGLDEDCDGVNDNNYPVTATTCGVGACLGNTGNLVCLAGSEVDTCDPFAGSSAEVCGSGYDEDCDGDIDVADSDCGGICDTDGDGFDEFFWCIGGGPNTDCNDSDANINPNATEICGNGVDDDCVGGDEECPAGAPIVTLISPTTSVDNNAFDLMFSVKGASDFYRCVPYMELPSLSSERQFVPEPPIVDETTTITEDPMAQLIRYKNDTIYTIPVWRDNGDYIWNIMCEGTRIIKLNLTTGATPSLIYADGSGSVSSLAIKMGDFIKVNSPNDGMDYNLYVELLFGNMETPIYRIPNGLSNITNDFDNGGESVFTEPTNITATLPPGCPDVNNPECPPESDFNSIPNRIYIFNSSGIIVPPINVTVNPVMSPPVNFDYTDGKPPVPIIRINGFFASSNRTVSVNGEYEPYFNFEDEVCYENNTNRPAYCDDIDNFDDEDFFFEDFEDCVDGVDNDGDSYIDEDDADCFWLPDYNTATTDNPVPVIIHQKKFSYDDRIMFDFETDMMTNASLIFYEDARIRTGSTNPDEYVCANVSRVIVHEDEFNPGNEEFYVPFHHVEAHDLESSSEYFYSIKVCTPNGKCSKSYCRRAETTEESFYDKQFDFGFVPPEIGDFSNIPQMKLDIFGEEQDLTAGLKSNLTNVTIKFEVPEDNVRIDFKGADFVNNYSMDVSSAFKKVVVGSRTRIGMTRVKWLELVQNLNVDEIEITIPVNGNDLAKCDDDGLNCRNVTSKVTLLSATANSSTWRVPISLGFSTYSIYEVEASYCGDGTCDPDEGCVLCSADCGACSTSSSSGSGGGSSGGGSSGGGGGSSGGGMGQILHISDEEQGAKSKEWNSLKKDQELVWDVGDFVVFNMKTKVKADEENSKAVINSSDKVKEGTTEVEDVYTYLDLEFENLETEEITLSLKIDKTWLESNQNKNIILSKWTGTEWEDLVLIEGTDSVNAPVYSSFLGLIDNSLTGFGITSFAIMDFKYYNVKVDGPGYFVIRAIESTEKTTEEVIHLEKAGEVTSGVRWVWIVVIFTFLAILLAFYKLVKYYLNKEKSLE